MNIPVYISGVDFLGMAFLGYIVKWIFHFIRNCQDFLLSDAPFFILTRSA